MDELLDKIYQEAKDSDEYPIMSRSKQFRNFYMNFQFFWVHLVSNANDQLYDGILLNFAINWLASLSFSKLRPIRHTATSAVLAMG
jgi:cohesin complex subunit SA-1/2